jgi:hypothetical protein
MPHADPSPIDPKDMPLSEVLESALQYMKETEAVAQRSVGYPKDLERCLRYQIRVLAAPARSGG